MVLQAVFILHLQMVPHVQLQQKSAESGFILAEEDRCLLNR